VHTKEYQPKCAGLTFRWISEPDDSPTAGWNKGLRMARGDIIGIINSDDFYSQDALKQVAECFRKDSRCEIVYGDVNCVDEGNATVSIKRTKSHINFAALKDGNKLMEPAVFMKKQVLEKIGFFDENFRYANDYEYWVRAAKNGIVFKHVPAVLANFRVLPTARSSGMKPELFSECLVIQWKYYSVGRHFAESFAHSVALYSQLSGVSLSNSFQIIYSDFMRKSGLCASKQMDNYMRRCWERILLRDAIYNVYKNRSEALKTAFHVLVHQPSAFLSEDGLIFFCRLVTTKDFYSSIKRGVKSLKGSKEPKNFF